MSGRVAVWVSKVLSQRATKTRQRVVQLECSVRVCAETLAGLPDEVRGAVSKLLAPEARAVDAMALADGLVVEPFECWEGEAVQAAEYACASAALERLRLRREEKGSYRAMLQRVAEHGAQQVVWFDFAVKLGGDAAQEALGRRGGGRWVWMRLRSREAGGDQISAG
jgi:hypothetical protein